MDTESRAWMKVIATVVFLIALVIGGGLWGCPAYNVYSQQMSGKAKLAEAQSSRQVAVLEARAKQESAIALAGAEAAAPQFDPGPLHGRLARSGRP